MIKYCKGILHLVHRPDDPVADYDWLLIQGIVPNLRLDEARLGAHLDDLENALGRIADVASAVATREAVKPSVDKVTQAIKACRHSLEHGRLGEAQMRLLAVDYARGRLWAVLNPRVTGRQGGLGKRGFQKPDNEKIVTYVAAGHSCREAAAKFHRSVDAVRKLIQRERKRKQEDKPA